MAAETAPFCVFMAKIIVQEEFIMRTTRIYVAAGIRSYEWTMRKMKLIDEMLYKRL